MSDISKYPELFQDMMKEYTLRNKCDLSAAKVTCGFCDREEYPDYCGEHEGLPECSFCYDRRKEQEKITKRLLKLLDEGEKSIKNIMKSLEMMEKAMLAINAGIQNGLELTKNMENNNVE